VEVSQKRGCPRWGERERAALSCLRGRSRSEVAPGPPRAAGGCMADGYEALEKLLDERLVIATELQRCADGDWWKEFDRAHARLAVVDTRIAQERLTLVRLSLPDFDPGEGGAKRHREKTR
jgi:hypothetical protein